MTTATQSKGKKSDPIVLGNIIETAKGVTPNYNLQTTCTSHMTMSKKSSYKIWTQKDLYNLILEQKLLL